jgi:tetratricopeptide (TPR) repeat protein
MIYNCASLYLSLLVGWYSFSFCYGNQQDGIQYEINSNGEVEKISSSSALSVSTCDYTDIKHLLSLVKQSSESRFHEYLENHKKLTGPQLNIGIISPFFENKSPKGSPENPKLNYSTYGYAINEYYAKSNGYYYLINSTIASDAKSFNWNSIAQLRNGLLTWGKDMDYLVFTTFESIFINFNLRIEQLFLKNKQMKKSNIIFLAGGAMTGSSISTDFIIVKNNHWTIDFLDDLWLTHYEKHSILSEIHVFDELYKLYKDDEYEDMITILPNNNFRNDYPAMSKYLSTRHHMLSFPLEVSEYKFNVYEEIFEMICSYEKKLFKKSSSSSSSSSPYPLQSSITREMLKMHSIETYRAIWDDKMNEYAMKATTGDNTPIDTDRLSTITVYLSNTITSTESDTEFVPTPAAAAAGTTTSLEPIQSSQLLSDAHNESMRILSKTFKQMYLNLKRYRNKLADRSSSLLSSPSDPKLLKASEYLELDSQYPNMLKAVLRLGQEYMSHIKNNPKELNILTEILRDILEDLVTINPKDVETQESLVYMNVDLGMEHMSHARYQQALSDFLSALRIARRVGNYIGDQIVLSPANQAAEAMVMLERYEEAVVLYDTVVPLTKKHNGAEDLTSGYIFIQAAFAYHQFGRHKTAHTLIEKAIEILEMNGVDRGDPKIYNHAKDIEKSTRGRRDEDDEAANREYGF